MIKENKVYMMIGLPGSGKSHYIHNVLKIENPDLIIASTDDLIDAEARKQGKTYTEIWPTINHKKIAKDFKAIIRESIKNRKDIIIDRTNLTTKSRKEILSLFPDSYEKIAIEVKISDELRKQRLQQRADLIGKYIPPHIISMMIESYNQPTTDEFDTIFTYP